MKETLYHFIRGARFFLSTYGCNQNVVLPELVPSGGRNRGNHAKSERVLELVRARGSSTPGVAFTYNEPTIWYEFVYDTARLLHEHGYANVMVSNGYIGLEALEELLPYIDGFNIDLKGFSDSFYQEYCRGRRKPVLRVLEKVAKRCHLEVTSLLIPSVNDDPWELEQMFGWLADLSPDLPLHISRYFPSHRLNLPPTPLEILYRAREMALEKLNYVYLGNVGDSKAAYTYCPRCSRLLIERSGYRARIAGLDGSNCRYCGQPIPLIL